MQGTGDAAVTPATRWREYDIKGKPGSLGRLPPRIAPYHLRLDWLMWFAAMSSYYEHPWFVHFMVKLLEGDRDVLGLLRTSPFPNRAPRYVRALLFEYHFTSPRERARTGNWWKRELAGPYSPVISLETPGLGELLERQGWMEEAYSHQ